MAGTGPVVSSSVTKDKVARIIQALSFVARRDVLVGIPSSAPARTDGPLTNAAIGYIQDRGSPLRGIPARPWLIPGILGAKDSITRSFGRAAESAMNGKAPEAEASLEAAGMAAQNSTRSKLNTGPFTPLAASTLRARRRRGRRGTKPLIDTGALRNSVTFVVREN